MFSNPNGDPRYIAPAGLSWNESNSLSVARFPFEGDEPPISYGNHDDLGVLFNPTCAAVGFTLVDNASFRLTEYVEFLDASGAVIAGTFLPEDVEPYRAFIGIVTPDRPVAAINVAEDADDGDDIGYDDFDCYPGTVEVGVDLKPGSYPNSVNINGRGLIPLAILGSDTFDVAQIDPATLDFAGLEVKVKKNGTFQCAFDDVSGDFTNRQGTPDGYMDLVCKFVDDPDRWSPDDGTATLTGRLFPEYGARPIMGSDTFRLVPPR